MPAGTDLKPMNMFNLACETATNGLDHVIIHVRVNPEFGPVVWFLDRDKKFPIALSTPFEIRALKQQTLRKLAFAKAAGRALQSCGVQSSRLNGWTAKMGVALKGFEKLDSIVSHKKPSDLFLFELR